MRILLDEVPSAWRNVTGELGEPLGALLHPETRMPIGPDDLADFLPEALVGQELTTAPWIDVPGAVLDHLRRWRPTPLVRATSLEAALGTPARIYYKDESVSPAGAHGSNTAVAQAFYNRAEGTRRLIAATGGGAWGAALALACGEFDLECRVYVVRSSSEAQPHRRTLMETWGADVVASPVADPGHPGSLGLAISDAVRDAAARVDSHHAAGSVLNHVLVHQSVIGLEARQQLEIAGERRPDVVLASCGGGAELGGIALPFLADDEVRLVAVEPSSCPTLTEGAFGYDFADSAGLMPLLPMFTLGHDFAPPPIHAGGLRYHGASPVISALVRAGRIEAVAYPQDTTLEAAVTFARTEGAIVAAETAHAVCAVIDEAVAAKELGEERVILFHHSGHGLLDLAAYDAHLHRRSEG